MPSSYLPIVCDARECDFEARTMSNATYSSCGGESNREGAMMMEGSDKHVAGQLIRICRKCAKMLIEVIDRGERRQSPG
jgi:hypothetical protein